MIDSSENILRDVWLLSDLCGCRWVVHSNSNLTGVAVGC
jgi:hypothetical protein